ncbi:hypothetical protein GCM10027053_31700 [Intrasporangium mesophilum]
MPDRQLTRHGRGLSLVPADRRRAVTLAWRLSETQGDGGADADEHDPARDADGAMRRGPADERASP